ncbi:hypothetical protein PHET_01694 [Paragonimus heterotremus]|uniref:Uncharacterized protein n=1 Tax=Paragonimus heterotremus TaxID=100268 RepID=A0A8J4ST48_9TREM|nr:hypothetical protein PHET_01694 [Paragonimus heterotremus]
MNTRGRPLSVEQQLQVQQVLRSELTQTKPNQAVVYERFGGSVFLPVSRDSALRACEEKLVQLKNRLERSK